MGRSVNKVTLIGTLGRDPEVRYMPNGNAVANMSLATDESYNDRQTGQKVEQTEWHRLVVYGKLAEICQQYLKKGSRAYFEGRLKTREWEKDGVKRYTTEINCNDMMMLDSRSQDGGMSGGYQQPGNAAAMMNPGYSQPQNSAPTGGYQQPSTPATVSQQPAPQQAVPQSQPQPGYQQSYPSSAPAPQSNQNPRAPQQPPQGQPQSGGYQQAPQPAPAPVQQPSNNFDDFDDDIPF